MPPLLLITFTWQRSAGTASRNEPIQSGSTLSSTNTRGRPAAGRHSWYTGASAASSAALPGAEPPLPSPPPASKHFCSLPPPAARARQASRAPS